MILRGLSALLFVLLPVLPVQADARTFESASVIEKAAHEFILAAARAHGGEPQVSLQPLDPQIRYARCDQPLTADFATGVRVMGNTSIGVRCPGSTPWTVYLSARIQVFADALVVSHPIARGIPLTANDLARRRIDLASFPDGTLTDPRQALGQRLRYPLATGSVLNAGVLVQVPLIRRGQTVTVISGRPGLEVRAHAEAMADGRNGDRIQVRNRLTRKVLEGRIEDKGLVRVPM